MLDKSLGMLSPISVIKCAIGINAFVAIFEKGMAKHIGRIIMSMLPHKGDGLTIIIFESIFANGTTIGTS